MAAENAGDYLWGIYEFPVDYSRPDNCNSKLLGRKPILGLDPKLGKLSLVKPEKAKPEEPEVDDVTTSESVTSQPEVPAEVEDEVPVPFYNKLFEFDLENELELSGPKSIWGRSLVLESPGKARICATIEPEVDESALKVAEAR